MKVALAEPEPFGDQAKALGQQIGKLPFSPHPGPEGGTVEGAIPAGSQLVDDRLLLAWVVLLQPVTEQRCQLMGQSQQDIVGAMGTGLGSAFDDLLELGLVEPRDHGGRQHPDRHAGVGQFLHHLEPAGPRAGSWLQLSPQGFIQGGDRHHHLAEALLGQHRQQIEVAQYHGALGDDPHRMAVGQHHFQQLAGEAIVMLDGLIRVGIGPQHYGLRLIGGSGKFPAQQLGGIEFGEQPGFEVEAGGELEIGVARSGITVNATVFAPLIGIDGATEGDIGGAVVTDDAAGADLRHLGAGIAGGKCRFPLGLGPAVVDRIDLRAAETVIDIVGTASSCHRIAPTLFIYTVIMLTLIAECKFCRPIPP